MVFGNKFNGVFTAFTCSDIETANHVTMTKGAVSIAIPYGFNHSLIADPTGNVNIVAINVIRIPAQFSFKNNVKAIAVNTGLKPANPLSISS